MVEEKNYNKEKIVRNILIVLTVISLVITTLNFTYLIYQNMSIESINDFLIKYVNNWLLWIDNILIFIFAITYIVLGIKSKKEVLLKVVFSIFSIFTTMIALTFTINIIAELFHMFN